MRAPSDNSLKSPAKFNGSDNLSWQSILLFCGLLISIIFLKSVLAGTFGTIGSDNDDVMRLVQIQDFLSGQSWFDTNQYRMGAGAGTDMHWSRLPDLPIIALTHLFSIFASEDKALSYAYSIWPPLTSILLVSGVLIGVKHSGEKKAGIFALIFLAVFIGSFYRYMPGSIDHHNLQIGFMALSMGFILDQKARFKTYFTAGLSVATALAIGVEIYVFAAVICGFVAILWAIHGDIVRDGAIGFGAGLFLGLLFAFLLTIQPLEYRLIYCDALSSVTLLAGALGGLGLSTLAFVAPRFSIMQLMGFRFAGLGMLGLVCCSALLLYAPQCLANPLASLPVDVQVLWLQNVNEAKSIFRFQTDKFTIIPMAIGAPIVALIVLVFRGCHNVKENDIMALRSTCFQFILIFTALAMTFYQIRYFPFAYIFALIVLSTWAARVFVNGKNKNSGSLGYLGCVILSVPFSWALPSLINIPPHKASVAAQDALLPCMSNDTVDVLKSLPQGFISANPNMTAPILMKTSHSVLGGNYHRNWAGIADQINISISTPETSKQILTRLGMDYLYFCKSSAATLTYSAHNSEGLFAEISRGNIPSYLKPIYGVESGSEQIFKYVGPALTQGVQ